MGDYEDFTNDSQLKLIYFLGIAKRKQLVHSTSMTYSLNQRDIKESFPLSSVEHFKTLMNRSASTKRRLDIFIHKAKRHHMKMEKRNIIRKNYADFKNRFLGVNEEDNFMSKNYQLKRRKEIEQPEKWIFSNAELLI